VPSFRPTTAQACNGGRGGALATLRATYADPVAVDDSARRYGEAFDGVAEEYEGVRHGYSAELTEALASRGGALDAVFSATAFHWVDPRVSRRKTAERFDREGSSP
jgi:hypothetical protein